MERAESRIGYRALGPIGDGAATTTFRLPDPVAAARGGTGGEVSWGGRALRPPAYSLIHTTAASFSSRLSEGFP